MAGDFFSNGGDQNSPVSNNTSPVPKDLKSPLSALKTRLRPQQTSLEETSLDQTKPGRASLPAFFVGGTAVAAGAAICVSFLVDDVWGSFASLIIPPTVLYMAAAVSYLVGCKQPNQTDRLATMAGATGFYLVVYSVYGFFLTGIWDGALASIALLAVVTGSLELRRWRRRISYLPLAASLATLAVTWLLRLILKRVYAPPILYACPGLLLVQSLLLLVFSVREELFRPAASPSNKKTDAPS